MPAVAIGTIVAKNFLAYARVLAASLRQHHPSVPFFVVLADEADGAFDPQTEPFEVVPIQDLGIPNVRQLCFWYPRAQVSIAVKPYLLRFLLNRGYAGAAFLDADILVLDSLDHLLQSTAAHSVALTPHLVGPLEGPDRVARELNILRCGVYNGGFIGVSSTASGRRFLEWWSDRLSKHCRHDVAGGFHYDQRWLDLVPSLFDDVYIERNAAYNVAYWNLPERDGVSDVRFFHFSGFEPEHPETVTRYSQRLGKSAIGRAAALFNLYPSLLEREGHGSTSTWPYAFDAFDNAVPIPQAAREIYKALDEEARASFGDPFCTRQARSFYAWLNESVRGDEPGCPVTRLWDAVYRSRPDVRAAYPDHLGADRPGFLTWMVRSGLREHQIADAFARLGLRVSSA
jgi:hypothetical protein